MLTIARNARRRKYVKMDEEIVENLEEEEEEAIECEDENEKNPIDSENHVINEGTNIQLHEEEVKVDEQIILQEKEVEAEEHTTYPKPEYYSALHIVFVNTTICSILFLILTAIIYYTKQSSTTSTVVHEFPRDILRGNKALKSWVIIPRYKLMFCGFPKAGVTTLHTLAQTLHPMPNCSNIYTCHKPETFDLTISNMTAMLRDSTWTKAVFLREPKERFLSGFRQKCEFEVHGIYNCPNGRPLKEAHNISFASFIDRNLADNWFHSSHNAHWIPQSEQCGGFANLTGYFDFIGVLSEPEEVYEQMVHLQSLNIQLQGEDITSAINDLYFTDVENTKQLPNRSIEVFKEYYTDYFEKIVEDHYQGDYEMMASLEFHPNATSQFRDHFHFLNEVPKS